MKRPITVTLSLWLVLTLTIWNIVKAWTLLAWHNVLSEFSARLHPMLSASMSLVWVIAGFWLLWSILQKKAWSVKLLHALATGYTVWYWSERLIWQNGKTNLWFTIAINLISLILIYLATKSISREAYERKIENPTTE